MECTLFICEYNEIVQVRDCITVWGVQVTTCLFPDCVNLSCVYVKVYISPSRVVKNNKNKAKLASHFFYH